MTQRCECPEEGKLNPGMAPLYHRTLELPFVVHPPGECRCDNLLKRYRREGRVLWLCSNCHLLGDDEVDT